MYLFIWWRYRGDLGTVELPGEGMLELIRECQAVEEEVESQKKERPKCCPFLNLLLSLPASPSFSHHPSTFPFFLPVFQKKTLRSYIVILQRTLKRTVFHTTTRYKPLFLRIKGLQCNTSLQKRYFSHYRPFQHWFKKVTSLFDPWTFTVSCRVHSKHQRDALDAQSDSM